MKTWRRSWRALLAFAGLLLLWQLASLWLKMEELPSAWETLRDVPVILSNGDDVLSILDSLRRMALGFALGLLIAVPLGLAMGRSKPLARLLNPLTALVYPIPKAALMPIIMLWLGIGDLSKVLVIFMGVSLPLLYHSCQGAEQVDDKLVWSAQAMGMGRLACLMRVILPAALPEVMLGCRVAVSIALITMISSEMIARRDGAGNLLFNAMDMAIYTDVYAVILIIAVIGVVLDVLMERLRVAFTHWADTLQSGPTS